MPEQEPLRIGGIEIYGLPEGDEPQPLPGGSFNRGGRGIAVGANNPPGEGGAIPPTGEEDIPQGASEFIKLWTTRVPEDVHVTALARSYREDPRAGVDWGTPFGARLMESLTEKIAAERDFPRWYTEQADQMRENLFPLDLAYPVREFLQYFHLARLVVGQEPASEFFPLSDFGINPELGEHGLYVPNPKAREINDQIARRHNAILENPNGVFPSGFYFDRESYRQRDMRASIPLRFDPQTK